jgi:hypothetical protein
LSYHIKLASAPQHWDAQPTMQALKAKRMK